jgi:SAM-dependent methyltransferase
MNFNEILSMFRKYGCKRILDAGCGTGKFVELDENIFGIDKNAHRRERIRSGNVVRMPFPNGSFEGVLSYQVLEHLPCDDAYRMLCECHRILKKGGILIINTPSPYKGFWDTFSHVKPYTPEAITKMLEDAYNENPSHIKFEVMELHYDMQGIPFASILRLTPVLRFLAKHFRIKRYDWTMILKKNG